MSLRIRARHRLGQLDLDIDLSLGPGLTVLSGPSGAGKTSTLQVIAGLIRPDHGRIDLDDTVLVDTDANRWTPPHHRHVGYVFQEARLFPHLRVRSNLTFSHWFGRHVHGVSLDEVVQLLDLAPLLTRYPATLSGGEQRRVAIGRALLSSPRVLLLDEPLGSVDIERRNEILPYLDRLIAARPLPLLYVTHDLAELGDRPYQLVTVQHGVARKGDRVIW